MKWLQNIWFYFPIRLFLAHFKSNILLVFTWLLLLLAIYGGLAYSYGAQFLFLNPEYLGKTNFFSFQLLGASFGIFFITWNIVSYLLLSYKYPFIASMRWPVAMFTFNNSIIPLVFILLYIIKIILFQKNEMFASTANLFWYLLGFAAGFILILLLSAVYFMITNKNIFGYLTDDESIHIPVDNEKWHDLIGFSQAERVDYYLSRRMRIRATREVRHYGETLLKKVFKQHHLNAFLLILFTLTLLVGLGFVIDKPIFELPAAGSIFLLFSVLTSVISLIYFWAGAWGNFAFVLFVVLFNMVSKLEVFHYDNEAYGMSYSQPKAIYHLDSLEKIASADNMLADKQATLKILEAWKAKATEGKSYFYKPKLVIVLSSGGGSRSSVFTMKIVQMADSLSQGQLMKNTVLMSGASGGMLGLAYYRELYLRTKLGVVTDLYDKKYQDKIGKDMLNKIWGTVVTNDLYYPIQMRTIDSMQYRLDRGMMMEKAFNENTDYILDKPMSAYKNFEKEATIPLMFLNAVNVADSRKMLMSPQKISYMMKGTSPWQHGIDYEIDAVDFGRFFEKNKAYNIRFTSALRMNASYPFILPSVSLPSTPKIDVVDAGFVDNFGIETAARFLNVFKTWINKNTDGVIIVQIRDNEKENPIQNFEYRSMFDKLFGSFGSLTENLTEKQDYAQDYIIDATDDVLKNKLEIVRFMYSPEKNQKKASLSFHISKKELEAIQNNAENEMNSQAMQRLVKLLNL
jgi:hypothetical protein